MTHLQQYTYMLDAASIEYTQEDDYTVDQVVVKVEGGYYGFYCLHSFAMGTEELISVESFE
jgi:hypothetical protein